MENKVFQKVKIKDYLYDGINKSSIPCNEFRLILWNVKNMVIISNSLVIRMSVLIALNHADSIALGI